jgi:hypothetical protein
MHDRLTMKADLLLVDDAAAIGEEFKGRRELQTLML